ncbi:MAG: hypothetical protein H0V09_01820 [Gemmatimonadetes bacterium]|nr:hypothetical protein [Gemmatimonadota bacterium]
MKVQLAVICDAANVSREGKLNILGIFSALRARQFPWFHPSLTLVVGLEATYTERGEHSVDIRLVDADGGEILKLDGLVQVQGERPGHPIMTQAVLQLNNVAFPHAGTYTLDILVDRRHERSLPLDVHQIVEATPDGAPEASPDYGSPGEDPLSPLE